MMALNGSIASLIGAGQPSVEALVVPSSVSPFDISNHQGNCT